jgi:D-glucosaminate-6-phosphate ammonia-lyase
MPNPTSQSSIYEKLGMPTVINAVGFSTRVGGSWPADEVIAAMAEAQRGFLEVDDLQAAASAIIAKHTGAEAGIVTCGAGAALTLAAAAAMVGSDVDAMEVLPDASTLSRNRIVYPKPHSFDYDHAIRLSGAQLDLIDYDAPDALANIEAAITDKTAAIGFVWKRMGQSPSVPEVAELAHKHGLPLIVDAALSLPPTEHLQLFITQGADLVTLSGGKHVGGPQASGLLFGKRDLVRSAWVQMVDMDVRSATWSLGDWVAEGFISRPPRHGIGRSMKVGKEAIVGVLTALERYSLRDHAAELAVWQEGVRQLEAALSGIDGLETESLFPAPNGQPYPVLRIKREAGLGAVVRGLRYHRPKVIFCEDEDDARFGYLFPMQLRDGEVESIGQAFHNVWAELEQTKEEAVA